MSTPILSGTPLPCRAAVYLKHCRDAGSAGATARSDANPTASDQSVIGEAVALTRTGGHTAQDASPHAAACAASCLLPGCEPGSQTEGSQHIEAGRDVEQDRKSVV